MSKKEFNRIKILEQAGEKKLTAVKGSAALGINIRQTYRILKRYREQAKEVALQLYVALSLFCVSCYKDNSGNPAHL